MAATIHSPRASNPAERCDTIVGDFGPLLGQVHLDNNDGAGDLHCPALSGKLTSRELEELAGALREIGYRGGLALELNAHNVDPERGLSEGRAIVTDAFGK